MGTKRTFAVDEWYHCFNRGIDKRNVFENEDDAQRFLMLLYLANNKEAVNLFMLEKPRLEKILQKERSVPLVAIGAYCLMPNHFHILLKEIVDDGISTFMQKLGTAYTMYFNNKHQRIGNLFLKPFRSRHVGTDRYFQRVLQYIHCNPAELYERGWKSGVVRNMERLERKLIEYPFSSFSSFNSTEKISPILSREVFNVAVETNTKQMLEEARAYYADAGSEMHDL